MHQAVCAECGKDCEVPFKPTGDKPVYCSNCFGQKDGSSGNRFERRDSGRSGFGDKKMFEAVCDKCHKACEVPFRPTGDKPVYCNDCFASEKGGKSNASGSDQFKKQFDALNSKLDIILNILSPKKSFEIPIKEAKAAKEDKKIAAKKVEIKVVRKKKAAVPKKEIKKVSAKKKK